MRTFSIFASALALVIPVVACGGSSDSSDTGSTTEDDLSTNAVSGTYAIVGHDALQYTSFQLVNSKEQPKTYFATGLCPKASWGIDCSQAPQLNGKWSVKGATITFTGDIKETFKYTISGNELHLSDSTGANETAFKKEATNGHFKPGDDCADMFGNPLGTCNGGDSFGCEYLGPNTNEMVCGPDW